MYYSVLLNYVNCQSLRQCSMTHMLYIFFAAPTILFLLLLYLLDNSMHQWNHENTKATQLILYHADIVHLKLNILN